ncbi:hypothetical protein PoB_002323600 [Plakobranchus ocellatus]|uniref:YqaJ viral recombinase domain-containing protein n=1 Tax=Plakobranchus ocellatus TaxID=259542 RepID=A0AAV3ZQE9_9GAST|nr:hypothetical protein PoB_002323600 [Plakobranchus ocellatus]
MKNNGISSVVEYKCFRSDEYQTQQEKNLQKWRKLSVNTGILTKIREINQLRGLLGREQLSRFTEREAIQVWHIKFRYGAETKCPHFGLHKRLRQVADLVCARTIEREYFQTCIVGHVNCWFQCGRSFRL